MAPDDAAPDDAASDPRRVRGSTSASKVMGGLLRDRFTIAATAADGISDVTGLFTRLHRRSALRTRAHPLGNDQGQARATHLDNPAICHARRVISPPLAALAEDPEFFIETPEGARRIVDDRFCVIIGPKQRWAGVCRLRMPADPAGFAAAVAEIRRLVEGVGEVVWNVGSSATPIDLPDRLRESGLRDPDPPMDAVVAAMALEEQPPAVTGLDVRRIETFEEHLAGLEIMLAADSWPDDAAADQRDRARDTFDRRNRRGGFQWLVWVGSKPVAFGAADRSAAGLYLAGGSTLPEARGRGCYRALVRARWDAAARLGIPGLAVQAQYGSSAPILGKLGFQEVATIHTLQ
jgi:GNAT superfamily N-acetyltransferase